MPQVSSTTLYIITGAPGAGKSTYGRQLASRHRAAFLDIDTASETLVQAALNAMQHNPDDRDSAFFKQTFRAPIYENVFAIAQENLPHISVVIAGPFTSEKSNANWRAELQQRFQVPVEIHYIHCSEKQLRRNIERRSNPRDAFKLANWDCYIRSYSPHAPLYAHVFVQPTYE
jgi:predicted kinase